MRNIIALMMMVMMIMTYRMTALARGKESVPAARAVNRVTQPLVLHTFSNLSFQRLNTWAMKKVTRKMTSILYVVNETHKSYIK